MCNDDCAMFAVLRAMRDDDAALIRYLHENKQCVVISSFHGECEGGALSDCMMCYDMRTDADGHEAFSFYLLVYADKTSYLEEAAAMLGVSERVVFLKHNSDPVIPVEGVG